MANKDFNEELNNENVSRINSAGLINSTLEKLWNDCYTAMAKGDYMAWNIKLDAIWAILGGDVPEGEATDKDMNKINMGIYNQGTLKGNIGKGFSKTTNPNNGIQYHLLLKKSLYLRRLQNKQGKGTAYQDKDEYDM